MVIDSRLLAIDPADCGCTDCLTGVYKPLYRATNDDIQALFLGIIADNTGATWNVAQLCGGDFTVKVDGYDFTITQIALPLTVDHYTLDLFPDTVARHRHRLGAHPTDTTPVVLGPQDAPIASA